MINNLYDAADFSFLRSIRNQKVEELRSTNDPQQHAMFITFFQLYPIIYSTTCQGGNQCSFNIDPAILFLVRDRFVEYGFEVELNADTYEMTVKW